jgi:hypothetical protein
MNPNISHVRPGALASLQQPFTAQGLQRPGSRWPRNSPGLSELSPARDLSPRRKITSLDLLAKMAGDLEVFGKHNLDVGHANTIC